MERIPDRPQLREDLLDAVSAAYGLTWAQHEPVDLGGGSSLNVGLDDVVVRVHRRWLAVDRLEAMQNVRTALASRGLPFIQPLLTRNGTRWIRWDGHLVEVERRAPGEFMDTWDRLLAGMRVLGTVHEGLAEISAPAAARVAPANNQIAVEEVTSLAEAAAHEIRSWPDVTDADRAAAELTFEHAQAISKLWAPYGSRLPTQLVHGDFWDNNVLFEDTRVVAVLDLDFMCERHRIDDLAIILYYVNSGTTLAGELPVAARRERLRELIDAYATVRPLTALEREALPVALARVMLKYTKHLLQRSTPSDQRAVLEAERPELGWSAAILRDLPDWQSSFR